MDAQYYLMTDGVGEGPYTIDRLRRLALKRHSLVWRDGWNKSLPLEQVPELAGLFPDAAPSESLLFDLYLATEVFFRLALVALVSSLFESWLGWVFVACTALGWASFLILLYLCWSMIQDGYVRTSAGAAVGLLFVPVFNCYWIFVATRGLAKELHAYAARHRLKAERPSLLLATAVAVYTLLSAVPVLGVIPFLLNMLLLPTLARSLYRTARCFCRANQELEPCDAVLHRALVVPKATNAGMTAIVMAPLGLLACFGSIAFTSLPYRALFDAARIHRIKANLGLAFGEGIETLAFCTLASVSSFLLVVAWLLSSSAQAANRELPASKDELPPA